MNERAWLVEKDKAKQSPLELKKSSRPNKNIKQIQNTMNSLRFEQVCYELNLYCGKEEKPFHRAYFSSYASVLRAKGNIEDDLVRADVEVIHVEDEDHASRIVSEWEQQLARKIEV